jgi:hypothetical protein
MIEDWVRVVYGWFSLFGGAVKIKPKALLV